MATRSSNFVINRKEGERVKVDGPCEIRIEKARSGQTRIRIIGPTTTNYEYKDAKTRVPKSDVSGHIPGQPV